MGYLLAIIWGALLVTSIYTTSKADKARIAREVQLEEELELVFDSLLTLQDRVDVLETGKIRNSKTVNKIGICAPNAANVL